VCHSIRANLCKTLAHLKHHAQDRWLDACVNGRNNLLCRLDTQMKDFAVAFLAAAVLVGFILYCTRIFIWAFT
jgi:hypothetical protein